ncbi:50S ribosomal subunit protein L29 [Candidatus Methylobacter favarea]|uniref:Large ribosomal subunit protein uL29 n=1 Tax=Candidatus Methylobacter favarea TaxID=2707345 RepID=A0A8S0Y9D8_9GAMM|nr:50S ribosomal protein L29 [Candidatus Methylobacter favarea]CAA9890008.1 50S ribosomal subunit protein L29 [Candidatus Methylobacter favarea]
MKASELRQKTKDELGSLLLELSREQFNLKMQKGTSQLSRPDQIKKVRRDVARIHTILNEMAGA